MRELFFDIKMAFRDTPWKVIGELIGAALYFIFLSSALFTALYIVGHFVNKYW